jgi:hypothetical protein
MYTDFQETLGKRFIAAMRLSTAVNSSKKTSEIQKHFVKSKIKPINYL